MNIRTINPETDSRWNDFVDKHPHGCVFHHSAWSQVLNRSFPQLHPFYCVAEDENSIIQGAIPCAWVISRITGKRLVSLPFSLYCDPLVHNREVFFDLQENIVSEFRAHRASYAVIRVRFAPGLFSSGPFIDYIGYKNHTLSLDPDLDELLHSFDRQCIRSHIHKGENDGIEIREATSENEIKTFFNLYIKTRKKFGTPPQPFIFFKNMWDILYPKNMLMVLIAKYRNIPICSLWCLKYKNRVHAECIGVDEDYRELSPNILTFWRAIQVSKQQGYQFFEFGGTSCYNTGLLHFKSRWGAVEEDIHHYFYPKVKGFSSNFSTGMDYSLWTKLIKKLPDWLFIESGNLAYRHLGG